LWYLLAFPREIQIAVFAGKLVQLGQQLHQRHQLLSWLLKLEASRTTHGTFSTAMNSYSALQSFPFLDASCPAQQRPNAGSPMESWHFALA
jgi:hypothetical protein